MNDGTISFRGAGPAARPARRSAGVAAARLLVDRLARRVVVLGGLAIIISILAILVVIVAEVVPLFRPPHATSSGLSPSVISGTPLAAGVDEYREVAYLVDGGGSVHFVPLPAGRPVTEAVRILAPESAPPTALAAAGAGRYALATDDGRVIPFSISFKASYDGNRRSITPSVDIEDAIVIEAAGGRSMERLAYGIPASGPLFAAQVDSRTILLTRVRERRSLIGGVTREIDSRDIRVAPGMTISALAIDSRGDNLFVGTEAGRLLRYDLQAGDVPRADEPVEVTSRPGAAVTTLGFLLGDWTLVVGDRAGGVSTWQLVRPPGGLAPRLSRLHDFPAHDEAVAAFARSGRDKGFLTADRSGAIHVNYGTTGRTLLRLDSGIGAIATLAYAPKADGLLAVNERGVLSNWELDNPHPEISWRALFGKVWYEGYDAPEYVWQSTGGTDDFEAKLSLTPLIFGTLKGTFYALLFAVPLALVGALYASQFMHPAIRGFVKPAVEIMAALPSVVLGFIAGLWLAPAIERIVPGIFVMVVVLPALILLTMSAWRRIPAAITGRLRPGAEVFLLMPVVILGGWLSLRAGATLEMWMLGGDYRMWIHEALGLTYDQRNSLVVGIAMGFAVIPIIFTIAEDSLSNVPRHLTAGSLALGATRWQTALKVVLPTASPGIFSAVMIGFGRAVGETMIVLMATGNTPVMDWSIFNGFRALSANIAVELPEAPAGGTLFRTLFLAALLLFILTFVVNTVAEVVRLKLRARYRYL